MRKLMIFLLLAASTAHANELEFLSLRSEPYQGPDYHWVSYAKMFYYLNQDRRQTLDPYHNHFLGNARNPETGMYEPFFTRERVKEQNPILGENPSARQVNAYFAFSLLYPYFLKDLPVWVQASFAESFAFTESMLVDQNNRMRDGERVDFKWPVGIVLVFSID